MDDDLLEALIAETVEPVWGVQPLDPADAVEAEEQELIEALGFNCAGVYVTLPHNPNYTFSKPKGRTMNHVFCTIDNLADATRSVIYRAWANSATCALIAMVAGVIAREKKAIQVRDDFEPEAEATGITAYSDLRDEAQDDNDASAPIGGEARLTLNQLVEWTAAVRALSVTAAEALPTKNADGTTNRDKQFARPQQVKDSVLFLCTPRTSVTTDQIEAVMEEEPELTREGAVSLIQNMAMKDALQMLENAPAIHSRVLELLADAPADREMDTIFLDLPENYREGLLVKAVDSVTKELTRTLPLAIRGIKGISGKRKVLKADLPDVEKLAA